MESSSEPPCSSIDSTGRISLSGRSRAAMIGLCRDDPAVPLNLWGFAAIAVPLVATPGASTAVVLKNSLEGGFRSGAAAAAGANTGSICYGLLTAFGVAVALQRW